MRILILGGTGFIGKEVIRALSGNDLWVFHRGFTCPDIQGVHHIQGDRHNLFEHRKKIQKLQPDVVLDMGLRNGTDAQRVIDTLVGATGRIVGISSGSVYRTFGVLLGIEPGPINNTPCNEEAALRRHLFPYRGSNPRPLDDPKHWLDEYDKIPAEQAFLSCADLPGCIIRLPFVYGPNDSDNRLGSYLKRMLDQQPILLHETAARWRNSRSFVSNVASAIACVVANAAPSRVYNVSDPNDLEESEWIHAIGKLVNWSASIKIVPATKFSNARPAINELPQDANFEQHLRLDSSRIREELGYVEPVGFEESLHRTVLYTLSSLQDWL